MASFCIGTMLGWTSPMQPLLESKDSPFGVPMTRSEISWLGSINFIGAILGTFFWGRLSDRLGRKVTGLLVALPFSLGWLIVILARGTSWLYFGRILIGVGCSGTIINVPMFVTEIAQNEIRGALGSFLMLSLNFGCLFCYIVGAFGSFYSLTALCLSVPLLYFCLLLFLPDSPVYLMSVNKKDEAERALLWYRGGDPVQTEKELSTIQGKLQKKSAKYSDLIESRGRIKGMIISATFIFGQQLCGILAILTYTVTIFKESGSSLTPYSAAIVVGCLQCSASFFSTVLVDKTGRRVLLLTSYITMSICLLVLSAYFFFHSQLSSTFAFLPVLCLSVHVIAYSIGCGPVPFIVMGEIFSPEVRGLAISTIQTLGTSFSFATVKLFPWLTSFLGADGCFLFFGLCCLILALITLIWVPETKGKTLQVILKRLEGETGNDDELEAALSKTNKIVIVKNMNVVKA